jgi:hypothetical protein
MADKSSGIRITRSAGSTPVLPTTVNGTNLRHDRSAGDFIAHSAGFRGQGVEDRIKALSRYYDFR